jgi:hypothetical protein
LAPTYKTDNFIVITNVLTLSQARNLQFQTKFKANCKIVMLSCPAFGNFHFGRELRRRLRLAAAAPPPQKPRRDAPIGTGDSAAADGPEAADFHRALCPINGARHATRRRAVQAPRARALDFSSSACQSEKDQRCARRRP